MKIFIGLLIFASVFNTLNADESCSFQLYYEIEGCEVCEGTGAECLLCSSGYYLDNGECVALDANCALGNSEGCTTPAFGYYIETDGSVTSCPSGCGICADGVCTVCQSGYFLNSLNNNCEPCSADNCSYCEQPDPLKRDNCIQCLDGYFFFDDDCLSSSEINCPDGNFLFQYTESQTVFYRCEACMDNCGKCYELETCLKCDEGYGLIDGFCLACPTDCETCGKVFLEGDYVENEESNTCYQCDEGKELSASGTCDACDESKCDFCDYKTGDCLVPTPTYVVDTVSETLESCSTILSNCLFCVDEDTCAVCTQGYYFSEGSGTCEQCHSECLTCSGPGSNNCIDCPAGKYRVTTGKVNDKTLGSYEPEISCVARSTCTKAFDDVRICSTLNNDYNDPLNFIEDDSIKTNITMREVGLSYANILSSNLDVDACADQGTTKTSGYGQVVCICDHNNGDDFWMGSQCELEGVLDTHLRKQTEEAMKNLLVKMNEGSIEWEDAMGTLKYIGLLPWPYNPELIKIFLYRVKWEVLHSFGTEEELGLLLNAWDAWILRSNVEYAAGIARMISLRTEGVTGLGSDLIDGVIEIKQILLTARNEFMNRYLRFFIGGVNMVTISRTTGNNIFKQEVIDSGIRTEHLYLIKRELFFEGSGRSGKQKAQTFQFTSIARKTQNSIAISNSIMGDVEEVITYLKRTTTTLLKDQAYVDHLVGRVTLPGTFYTTLASPKRMLMHFSVVSNWAFMGRNYKISKDARTYWTIVSQIFEIEFYKTDGDLIEAPKEGFQVSLPPFYESYSSATTYQCWVGDSSINEKAAEDGINIYSSLTECTYLGLADSKFTCNCPETGVIFVSYNNPETTEEDEEITVNCGYDEYYDSETTSCLECSSHTDLCSRCYLELDSFGGSQDFICMECESGYYFDEKTDRCENCAVGCLTCSGSSYSLCTELEESETSQIYYNVNEGEYSVRKCSDVVAKCKKCDGNECTKCEDGYTLEDNKCTKCNIQNCNECVSGNNGQCKTCADEYGTNEDRSQCKRCEVGCIHCAFSDNIYGTEYDKYCYDCDEDYALVDHGECIEVSCDESCSSCDTNNNCLGCKEARHLLTPTGPDGANECTAYRDDNCKTAYWDGSVVACSECNSGYNLPDTNSGVCYRCDIYKCETCNSSGVCTKCESGFFLDGYCKPCADYFTDCTECEKDKCTQCSLEAGFYINSGGLCKECHKTCLTCIDRGHQGCTSCPSGRYGPVDGGKCLLVS